LGTYNTPATLYVDLRGPLMAGNGHEKGRGWSKGKPVAGRHPEKN